MRFMLRERNFDVVACPPRFSYNESLDHHVDLDGKLCYINNVLETTFDMWKLEDDGIHQPKL